MPIRAVVWGENVHEQTNRIVADLYPKGMHGAIADALNADNSITATTAVRQVLAQHLPIPTSLVP